MYSDSFDGPIYQRYACGRCGEDSSMLGHFTEYCSQKFDFMDTNMSISEWFDKTKTSKHFCCPNNCELAIDTTTVS